MSESPPLDILAFAPHPDDAEVCCGGLLISMAQKGYRTGIVDLTRGELGSNGSVADREREAAAAAEVMGLAIRENLGLPDGWLSPWGGHDLPQERRPAEAQVAKVVESIRRLQPEIVLLPWKQGRHPDHRAAHALVSRALFLCNIRKFETEPPSQRFLPKQVLHYQMRYRFRPSFVVDISHVAEQKQRAIHCYASQFQRREGSTPTLINDPNTLDAATIRDRYYGATIGVAHAEPYLCTNTLGITDPLAHFRQNPTQAQFFEEE